MSRRNEPWSASAFRLRHLGSSESFQRRVRMGITSSLAAKAESSHRAACRVGSKGERGNVPATRLLVVADSKMLAALANGLREGGKFDVLTVPLAEAASAEAAAERADALVIFYGTPDKALPAALQALS